MMALIGQKLLTRSANSTLFYSSLLGTFLLSNSSYILSYIAIGTLDFNAGFIGYYMIVQYTLMSVFMLLAWKASPKSKLLSDYKLLLIVAIAARVLLIDVQAYSSNDVDRYLFDGRIAVEGLDPYRVSHDSPELQVLREQWQPPQEHAKYVTLYPPVALALFSLSAAAGITHAVLVWKLILLCASVLTLWLMARVLQGFNKLEHLALVALSPLLILETSVGLHLDAISTLAIVTTLYFWQRHNVLATAVVIGLGMSTKVLPIMLLLPLIFTFNRLSTAVKLVAVTILTLIGVYGLSLFLGFHPVGSVSVFFEKWRAAAPLFLLLDNYLSGEQSIVLLLVVATTVCSLLAYICWSNRSVLSQNPALLGAVMQMAIALPLLLSPVVFPWYLMPLVPLLALYPNKYLIIWMCLLPFTYEVIGQFICCQIWQPAQWPVWLLGLFQITALIALVVNLYRTWPKLTASLTSKQRLAGTIG